MKIAFPGKVAARYVSAPATEKDCATAVPATSAWKCPASHVQFVLAMGLVEKIGHSSHTAAPVVAVNVLAAQSDGVVVATGQNSPAGQGRHDALLPWPVSGLYVPAVQFVGSTDLIGQKFPDGHMLQSSELAAPVEPRYVPAGQSMGVTVVVELQYWPTGHGRHTDWVVCDW